MNMKGNLAYYIDKPLTFKEIRCYTDYLNRNKKQYSRNRLAQYICFIYGLSQYFYERRVNKKLKFNYKYMASMTGMSKRTLIRICRELEENRIILMVDGEPKIILARCLQGTAGGCLQGTAGGVYKAPQKPGFPTGNPLNNNDLEKKCQRSQYININNNNKYKIYNIYNNKKEKENIIKEKEKRQENTTNVHMNTKPYNLSLSNKEINRCVILNGEERISNTVERDITELNESLRKCRANIINSDMSAEEKIIALSELCRDYQKRLNEINSRYHISFCSKLFIDDLNQLRDAYELFNSFVPENLKPYVFPSGFNNNRLFVRLNNNAALNEFRFIQDSIQEKMRSKYPDLVIISGYGVKSEF